MYLPTQLSHRLQWEALGGRNILHVKQYFNFTTCPLITTSLVRGGGLYAPLVVELGISEIKIRSDSKKEKEKKNHTILFNVPQNIFFFHTVILFNVTLNSSCYIEMVFCASKHQYIDTHCLSTL